MIKYLGSKRTLVPLITAVIGALPDVRSVLDLYSGTSRVGHALKAAGLQVLANDHNAYAAALARCDVAAAREDVATDAARLRAELSALPPRAGWFTRTYCEGARFFMPHNGARVDAMRDQIAAWSLPPELESVLLVALMEAADRVDSPTGVQMAFLKQWARRASNELTLRMPAVLPRARAGKGSAHQLDAADAVGQLQADVAYLDPPYNHHKYLGNYHIWESLVRWDQPEVYGIAHKRIDCRDRSSAHNSRPHAEAALRDVVERVQARHLVVSFNNEGFLSLPQLHAMLRTRGEVRVITQDFRRYIGAQIGIYNPQGEKVGQVSHLTNQEHLLVVTEDPDRLALPEGLLQPLVV